MTSNHKKSTSERYLQQYPRLSRWINVCVRCGTKGYKPELPENVYPYFNVAGDNLRELFNPLTLNEYELCEVCARVADSQFP
jgi:hypothetical protein